MSQESPSNPDGRSAAAQSDALSAKQRLLRELPWLMLGILAAGLVGVVFYSIRAPAWIVPVTLPTKVLLGAGGLAGLLALARFVLGVAPLQRWGAAGRAAARLKSMLVLVLLCCGAAVVWALLPRTYDNRQAVADRRNYAIGLRQATFLPDRVELTPTDADDPLLTWQDVTDAPAAFVADPFLVHDGDRWHIFFEIWNAETDQGDIALATSTDARNWQYRQVVLDEPFTLSYPCVFSWNGQWFMVPETRFATSVRLYEADPFPTTWKFTQTLIDGVFYRDNTVFSHAGRWWLFAVSGNSDTLHLYTADTPRGPWTQHPRSPVVTNNPDHARPAGNVVRTADGRLIRFAQDCYPYYGNQVWALEVTALDPANYAERLLSDAPILKGHDNWNTLGMHQFSAVPLPGQPERWLVAVDGR